MDVVICSWGELRTDLEISYFMMLVDDWVKYLVKTVLQFLNNKTPLLQKKT